MLNSFFDHDHHQIKKLALIIKQYLDHREEYLAPETYVNFTQAIEHLVIAYIYVSHLDMFLTGKCGENELNENLLKELKELTQLECLECQI